MKRKPNNPITKIRTGTGDAGTTYLQTPNVRKDSALVEFIGDLDEACALMGNTKPSFDFGSGTETDFQLKLAAAYNTYQKGLFEVGAMVHSQDAREKYLYRLDEYVTEISELLEEGVKMEYVDPLEGFIIPNEENADLMLARAVIRRCERRAIAANQLEFVPFLNALSDFIFFIVWESSHYFEQWKGF